MPANLAAGDVMWLGHTKVIVHSDNEPALQTLITESLDALRVKTHNIDQIATEHPAAYDSQSNGGTEVGVKLVRGLFRTLKLCLESRIDKYVPINHALVPWLLQHTCMLLNARFRGTDGRTPWARVRGRPFNQRLLGFGELVMYKLPGKGPRHQPNGNMGAQWKEAVFVGYHRSSNSYILIDDGSVAHSRSITRRAAQERWSVDALANVKATPWSIRERPGVQVHFHEAPAERDEGGGPSAPALPRRFRINQKDLDEHGYTEGCAQCVYIRRYGSARPGGGHTGVCRARIIESIGKSELGQQRLQSHEDRVNRALAEGIEYSDANMPADRRQPRRGDGRFEERSGEGRTPVADHSAADPLGVRGAMEVPADEMPIETPVTTHGDARTRQDDHPGKNEGIRTPIPDLTAHTPVSPVAPGAGASGARGEDDGDDAMEEDGAKEEDVSMGFI